MRWTVRIGARSFAALAASVLVVLAGCAMPTSYTILHVPSGRRIPIPVESSGREVVLGVSDAERMFKVLGGQGALGKGLVLRTVSYDDGRVLDRVRIPVFSDYFERFYVYGRGYAVSPSARRVAYLDRESKALMVFDTQARSQSVLWPNFAENWVNIGVLQWVSDKKLLAGASVPGDTNTVLLLLDAEEHSVEVKLQPRRLYDSNNALSPSGRYFAYFEPGEVFPSPGSFKILDLVSKQVVAEVKAQGFLSGKPLWSCDSEELIYVEGNSLKESNSVKRFRLVTGTSEVLKAQANRLLRWPLNYTGRHVFCGIHEMDGFPKKPPSIYVLDLKTGEESVIPDPEIWGEIFVADGGKVVIYGMGQ